MSYRALTIILLQIRLHPRLTCGKREVLGKRYTRIGAGSIHELSKMVTSCRLGWNGSPRDPLVFSGMLGVGMELSHFLF